MVWLLVLLFIGTSCKQQIKSKTDKQKLTMDALLNIRYTKLLNYPLDSAAFPRNYSYSKNEIQKVSSNDWTSGFYAGNLWMLYDLTKNVAYKNAAQRWTAFIEKEKFNSKTHDMGFKVFSSFGKGLEFEDNKIYKAVIIESAKTLSKRFNKKIGSIRSWDFSKNIWQFPVIIDNMMNLELLFEATKISGDNTFHKIAVTHAKTTLKNHFRKDNSTYHVVDYDTISGQPRLKVTHQGFNDESSWSRGQGWAIYGYTMVYRYTKDPVFLEQAKATAAFYLNHENLPKDGIPYWDFDDPTIPKAPKDVSAATLIASGLIELYNYTNDETYLNYSKKVMNSLHSPEYIVSKTVDAPFILNHSTGNWPKNDEIDEPIVYADYYFLETLLRLKQNSK